MATDAQFVATGPAPAGFQTKSSTFDEGANITGNLKGAEFHAISQGVLVAAVTGDSPYGSGFIGGNANDDSTLPDRPRGVYGESDVAGGIGVEGIGASVGVGGQLLSEPYSYGWLGGRDPAGKRTGALGHGDERGVVGLATSPSDSIGVFGKANTGVCGESFSGNGVLGISHHGRNAAISAVNDGGGYGLYAEARSVQAANAVAGFFRGDVEVTGDIRLINGDIAEDFDLASMQEAEPGTVMVLNKQGQTTECGNEYDSMVVGVVAGAGSFKPAIILGRDGSDIPRKAIALVGKVYCKVDARDSAIKPGDLLTTSSTRGHAMRVQDRDKAFGAVIGKALQGLDGGLGLIPIVIALQ